MPKMPWAKRVPASAKRNEDISASAPATVEQLSSPHKAGMSYASSPRFASPAHSKDDKTYSSFSPFRASESTVILSKVITAPKDWCDEGLLIPHEALRQDLFAADEVLKCLKNDGTAAWKLANFFIWFREYHYPNVHHHHDAEELIYFPWMRSRVALPEKLAKDHDFLIAQMDKIDSLYTHGAELDAAATGELIAALQREWGTYKEFMVEHLAEEESVVPALLRENFTIEEEAAVIDKIIQSLGLTGNKLFLPLIIDAMQRWGGERKVAEFKQNIPPPILFLLDYFWTPDYLNRQKLLLHSLKADEDPLKPQPSCVLFGG